MPTATKNAERLVETALVTLGPSALGLGPSLVLGALGPWSSVPARDALRTRAPRTKDDQRQRTDEGQRTKPPRTTPHTSQLAGLQSAKTLFSINVFVWRGFAERAARFFHQIALDEDVDVAVEHAVDVADLLLRAVVLHHLIWMQDVAPDLAAEGDVFFRAADLIELCLVLFRLEVVEPRFQHLHRRVTVPMLRSLVLARHDDAGGKVRDADGGVGNVDVLPSGATRPVRVDAEILLFDLDVDVFRQLGPDVHRRERRVAPRGLIERRDADEPANTGLRGKQTVGVITGNDERRAFQAGFVAQIGRASCRERV